MAIMPEHYHRLDESWITRNLAALPQLTQIKVADKYSDIYKEAYEKEIVKHKKDGAARKAANNFLRRK